MSHTCFPKTCPICSGKRKIETPEGYTVICPRCQGSGILIYFRKLVNKVSNTKIKMFNKISEYKNLFLWQNPLQPITVSTS